MTETVPPDDIQTLTRDAEAWLERLKEFAARNESCAFAAAASALSLRDRLVNFARTIRANAPVYTKREDGGERQDRAAQVHRKDLFPGIAVTVSREHIEGPSMFQPVTDLPADPADIDSTNWSVEMYERYLATLELWWQERPFEESPGLKMLFGHLECACDEFEQAHWPLGRPEHPSTATLRKKYAKVTP